MVHASQLSWLSPAQLGMEESVLLMQEMMKNQRCVVKYKPLDVAKPWKNKLLSVESTPVPRSL